MLSGQTQECSRTFSSRLRRAMETKTTLVIPRQIQCAFDHFGMICPTKWCGTLGGRAHSKNGKGGKADCGKSGKGGRAVVAKAAPLLQEIWVIRVESRQPVLDRCHRATTAPSWCRQPRGSDRRRQQGHRRAAAGPPSAWRSTCLAERRQRQERSAEQSAHADDEMRHVRHQLHLFEGGCWEAVLCNQKPKMLAARCWRSVRSD